MWNELKNLIHIVINYKHPKLIFRQIICRWNCVSQQWVVPKEIYDAIEKYDTETAQKLLDKQCEFWDRNDPEAMRAQSYIDLLD